jgi:hypothetical protein
MFDFKSFIENLSENPEKKDIVEKYEKLVESLPEKFEDTIIYKNYLSKFNLDWIDLLLPEYIDEDFDWDLLLRLIVGSFSSTYVIEKDEETWKDELIINVSAWDKHVAKKLSELWWFQIARMYEIYVEEQMNLEILANEDENEKDIVLAQRQSNLDKWNLVLDNLKVRKLKEQEEKEKQEKLDDLMSQL